MPTGRGMGGGLLIDRGGSDGGSVGRAVTGIAVLAEVAEEAGVAAMVAVASFNSFLRARISSCIVATT